MIYDAAASNLALNRRIRWCGVRLFMSGAQARQLQRLVKDISALQCFICSTLTNSAR